MKKLFAALFAALLLATPAAAQSQVPEHYVPIGKGAGQTGFNSAAPDTAGNVLTSNGASSDPTFQNSVPISISAFAGFDSSGATDQTAVVAAAIAAAPAGGCDIYLPVGTFKLSLGTGTISITKPCHIHGAGRDATTISVNHATNDVFTVSGGGTKSLFDNFTMTNAVTRTAGSYIKGDTIRVGVRDVYLNGPYVGITFTDNCTLCYYDAVEMRNVTPNATAAGSACVVVGRAGGGTAPATPYLIQLTCDTDTPASPYGAGIKILSVNGPEISNNSLLHAQDNFLVNPGAGDGALAGIVSNPFFDSAASNNCYLVTTTTGNIVGWWFAVPWMSNGTAGAGCRLESTSTGIVAGIDFVQPHMNNNLSGLQIIGANWTYVSAIGGCLAGNSTAAQLFTANISHFKLQNAQVGNCDNFGVNTTGVSIAAGTGDYLMLQGSDFSGSTTPVSGWAGATGTHNIARNNTPTSVNATANTVAEGGTGLTSGTSGGVPYFSAAGTMASSGALAANQLVLGGGAGAAPASLGSLGTTTTVYHGNAAGAGSFGAVALGADVSGQLPVANGGTACAAASGTCVDNISGFASTGILKRTGAGAYSFISSIMAIGGNSSNALISQNTTVYIGPTFVTPNEYDTEVTIPFNGTIKNLYVNVTSAAGAGQSYTATLMSGTFNATAASTLTCTISGASALNCNDTTHTVSVTAGQVYTLRFVSSATAANTVASWGAELDNP